MLAERILLQKYLVLTLIIDHIMQFVLVVSTPRCVGQGEPVIVMTAAAQDPDSNAVIWHSFTEPISHSRGWNWTVSCRLFPGKVLEIV